MVGELLGCRLQGGRLLGGRITALSLIRMAESLHLLHGIGVGLHVLLGRESALEVVGVGGVNGVFVVVSRALGVAHLNMGLLAGVLHV